jgi:hypothetical protein
VCNNHKNRLKIISDDQKKSKLQAALTNTQKKPRKEEEVIKKKQKTGEKNTQIEKGGSFAVRRDISHRLLTFGSDKRCRVKKHVIVCASGGQKYSMPFFSPVRHKKIGIHLCPLLSRFLGRN